MLAIFQFLFLVMLWGAKCCPFLFFEFFGSGRLEKSFEGPWRAPRGGLWRLSGGLWEGLGGVWELLEEPGEALGRLWEGPRTAWRSLGAP